ncbi:hypothetical protein RFI_10638 [Reticulomyxa filosa]|uniref:Uncharacterized protein n=1 Tax=Reticulomyxa filosa TaxID=46433 RepID=X6NJL9_RETFI|nr:hypothetical protein RFI_10638 [Reticulomyxa filosa]|eukprot:ETO26500.1 hypothetical protein RFI_10638 [Reticulomyxa filosa]
MIFGKHITPMDDRSAKTSNTKQCKKKKKKETDGYIFVRGVIDKEAASNARRVMLTQAAKEGSVEWDDENDVMKGRIVKHRGQWSSGYCIDGITGSETNERDGIDVEKWEEIGPSRTCKAVYNGADLRSFWEHLFGHACTRPLVKQTFLRLMGESGTMEHADYYYFKRDTHIFSGNDGQMAMKASQEYLTQHRMWDPTLYVSS